MLDNGRLQLTLIGAINRKRFYFSATLLDAKHGLFADTATPGMQLLCLVFVSFLAANVSLVNFYFTVKDAALPFHRFANTMIEEPCALLRYAEFLSHLDARYTFTSRMEHVNCHKPFV